MGSASPVSSAHDPCTRPSRQFSLLFLQLFKSGVLRRSLCTSIAIVLALACLPSVEAALRNATIDDQEGNELTKVPTQFLPITGGVWEGEECGGCRVKPDPAFAFKNTYNAATYRPEAGVDPVEFGFQFTGSALYVFLTLAHNCGDQITTLTETNFTMDDGPATFFRHTPNMSRTDFDYQYPAYVQENMEHRTHTFKATTSGPDYHIFINFDYAIYTYDDALFPNSVGSGSSTSTTISSTTAATSSTATSTSTSTSSTSSGSKNLIPPIVGGVVGGLAIFGLFIFALIYIRRHTRKASTPAYLETELQGGAGVVGASGSGMGRWRRRRDEAREYPDPQIFASNDQLNETRYARSGYTTTQGLSSITPFTYNSIPTASTHSLGGPMQGDSSVSANGSGSSGAMYPPGPYAVDTGRGSRRGGGEATSPQHSRNHRVGGSGGAASDNTGLSYLTDLRSRDMELPRYTPGLPSDSGHQHGYSHSNQDVLSVGSGSSMTGNPYGGIEESVYAATGVRLDPMPPRRTYHALNHQGSSPTLTTPPPPGAGGAAQPMSDLDTQMHALQDSIRLVIANLQIEREALSARGMSHEAIQRDAGLEKMTENLRRMAEEMSVLQQRGEAPTESRRTTSTQPPSYASWGPRD